MNVTIDGVVYVPAEQVKAIRIDQQKTTLECLKILTDLRRNDYTKRIMKGLAWDVIYLLDKQISQLTIEQAYTKLHPDTNTDDQP